VPLLSPLAVLDETHDDVDHPIALFQQVDGMVASRQYAPGPVGPPSEVREELLLDMQWRVRVLVPSHDQGGDADPRWIAVLSVVSINWLR